ncbi:YdiU family protein [Paraglaciecola sp. L3A3]|uniref:protein adenylyltransferase SelO n=1 Tax=Paraglaciecola sp. L3A3 TaxID=2686358 RepID=UPI00131AF64B|nr:YdiU family protein [Paraglaciecola sp. L3A3]
MLLEYSFATELTGLTTPVKSIKLNHSNLQIINYKLFDELNLPKNWQEEHSLFVELFSEQGKLNRHSVAQKYGGHQFGHWNPQLGDGRGLLLAEVIDPQKQRWDIHLKGAGPTPYSRGADGRAVLRSTIREYLASEALHHLGIPSSRALALISSEEPVYREKQEPGAMLLRTCQSHIRFGHFEYFFHSGQTEKLQQLFDYCFKYHFIDCLAADNPYRALLEKITQDTAKLIAKWQAFGFNHGVMNTDNMSIHGITFDYGPYAFLDDFEPNFICNHSDPQGRYSFDSQPSIGLWNLNSLAQAFTQHLDVEQIKQVLGQYESALMNEYSQLMLKKCGLVVDKSPNSNNVEIVNGWLDILATEKKDFTISFRQLCEFDAKGENQTFRDQFIDRDKFDNWAKLYSTTLLKQTITQQDRQAAMKRSNPKVILRNYLAQQVIDQAEDGNFSLLNEFIKALEDPYADKKEYDKFSLPPPNWGKKLEISCSS